jgi:hypothetical protein
MREQAKSEKKVEHLGTVNHCHGCFQAICRCGFNQFSSYPYQAIEKLMDHYRKAGTLFEPKFETGELV